MHGHCHCTKSQLLVFNVPLPCGYKCFAEWCVLLFCGWYPLGKCFLPYSQQIWYRAFTKPLLMHLHHGSLFVGTMRAGTAIKSWGRLNDCTPGCGIHQRPPQHMGPVWYLCQNFRRWREFIYLFPTKQSNFVSYKYRLNLHVHCWQITKLIGENIVQFQPYIHCNIFIRFRHK